MKLLETLLCIDGVIKHQNYHQARMQQSVHALFGMNAPHIAPHLAPPKKGTFRVRIIYDAHTLEVSYIPYTPVFLNTFAPVHTHITYAHKFFDRSALEALKTHTHIEPIIIKNGLITDTTIANIAIWDGFKWLTPRIPLLYGTTRARLSDEKKLTLADIDLSMLCCAPKIAMMNALTGFYEIPIFTLEPLKDLSC